MAIPLRLQVFEGPMDLLMHLIDKNKIDIYDIPIVTITDQYLEYVRQMEHEDMNVTSEFLVMAATLLDIKSRLLLPAPESDEEEEDPRDELVRRLLEYKMYKYMSEELRERGAGAGLSYYREQDLPDEVRSYIPPIDYEKLIGDRTLESLTAVFQDVLRRRNNRVDPIRSSFREIQREKISVADKELYIRAYLKTHPQAEFRDLLETADSKEEVIVTFLVVLELMKNQRIRIVQEETFGTIRIELRDEPGGEVADAAKAAVIGEPEAKAPLEELPGTEAEAPLEEQPGTEAETPLEELPGKEADAPLEVLPETEAAMITEELPSTEEPAADGQIQLSAVSCLAAAGTGGTVTMRQIRPESEMTESKPQPAEPEPESEAAGPKPETAVPGPGKAKTRVKASGTKTGAGPAAGRRHSAVRRNRMPAHRANVTISKEMKSGAVKVAAAAMVVMLLYMWTRDS